VVPLFAHVRLPRPSTRIGAYVLGAAVRDIPLPTASAPPDAAHATRATGAAAAARSPTASPAAPSVAPTGIAGDEPPPLPTGGSLAGVAGAVLGAAAPVLGAVPPPPVTPPPSRPLRVGGDIRVPRKVHHVAPVYPAIAAQARVAGTVVLEAVIAPSGDVVDVRVLRSVPLLDRAAADAVRQWRYDPTLLNGAPVAVLLTVTVHFSQ
jgi:protein TonB